MERRKFIITCCKSSLGLILSSIFLNSCDSIYYATSSDDGGILMVAKSEFIKIKKDHETIRKFVLLKSLKLNYPICLYRVNNDKYIATLMKCTHQSCELNVGGGIYSCPCHGSEFSIEGEVLEGPAERKLKTFQTKIDHENIYVYLS